MAVETVSSFLFCFVRMLERDCTLIRPTFLHRSKQNHSHLVRVHLSTWRSKCVCICVCRYIYISVCLVPRFPTRVKSDQQKQRYSWWDNWKGNLSPPLQKKKKRKRHWQRNGKTFSLCENHLIQTHTPVFTLTASTTLAPVFQVPSSLKTAVMDRCLKRTMDRIILYIYCAHRWTDQNCTGLVYIVHEFLVKKCGVKRPPSM